MHRTLDCEPVEWVDQTPRAVIVSGIGRSGTGYVAEVLRQCGLRATHKHVFRGGQLVPCVHCLEQIDVEVSGFAMPHLQDPGFRLHPVVLVVRHPLEWLSSWRVKRYASSYLRAHIEQKSAGKWVPDYGCDPMTGPFVDEALKTWVLWNLHVAKSAHFFFRVEEMKESDVRAIALLSDAEDRLAFTPTITEALEFTPTNFNTASHDPRPTLYWRSLPKSSWIDPARKLARHFGYDC